MVKYTLPLSETYYVDGESIILTDDEHNLSDSDGADSKGSRLIKGRLGRAFGLGKVATKVASGYLIERLNRKSDNPEQQFEP